MNFLLGLGRLGSAIYSSFKDNQIVRLERSVYADWWRDGATVKVTNFFERYTSGQGTVFVAAGVIDTHARDEHHKINFLLPKNILEGALKAGFRVITFGTVMEKIVPLETANSYIASKIRLGNLVLQLAEQTDRVLHIRMHTLYGGGQPAPCMFLGEIFSALRRRSTFNMSAGNQLREYHHIEDEMLAITHLVNHASGVTELSHGQPVTLRALAEYIFDHFYCPELLKIGSLSSPKEDNYKTLFQRSHLSGKVLFRDTLPAVVDYLKQCMQSLESLPSTVEQS